jgi:hypothetical protein
LKQTIGRTEFVCFKWFKCIHFYTNILYFRLLWRFLTNYISVILKIGTSSTFKGKEKNQWPTKEEKEWSGGIAKEGVRESNRKG